MLNHPFWPNVPFLYLLDPFYGLKRHKNFGFLTFSGVIEIEYWAKLGQVKKYYVKVNADIRNHAEFECYQN